MFVQTFRVDDNVASRITDADICVLLDEFSDSCGAEGGRERGLEQSIGADGLDVAWVGNGCKVGGVEVEVMELDCQLVIVERPEIHIDIDIYTN